MSTRTLLASMVLTTAMAGPLMAQQVLTPDGPVDLSEMRARLAERMKDMLGVTDEQWKTLQPRIEKIQELQRDAYPRSGPMMFGPGGPGGFGAGPGGPPPGFGGPGSDQQPSDVQQKTRDLREALDNKDTPAEEINAKAQALRDARAKAKADLSTAQDDLKQSVNPKQQAVLLAMGVLE